MSDGVLLRGVDGGNPLGFLAAMGVLHLLSLDNAPRPAIRWTQWGGGWRPVVHSDQEDIEGLITKLHECLERSFKATKHLWTESPSMPFDGEVFRRLAVDAIDKASQRDRRSVDLLAAIGVDTLRDKQGRFLDTHFRLVRSADSAGNGFTAYGVSIIESTIPDHLQQVDHAVLDPSDDGRSLRWSPDENRAYAMQWDDPSAVGIRSSLGLNRLAIDGLNVFPTVPSSGRAETVGFTHLEESRTTVFTWPIWSMHLALSVVRSLIVSPDLSRPAPPPEALRARGVIAAFRSVRFASSKYYSNFTPAQRIA